MNQDSENSCPFPEKTWRQSLLNAALILDRNKSLTPADNTFVDSLDGGISGRFIRIFD